LDFLSNGIGFGFIAFGIGWISAGGTDSLDLRNYFIQALPYFFGMSCGSIGSTIPDETGDRQTGKITTIIYLGRERANLICILFLVLSLLFSIYNSDFLMIIMSMVSLPLFIKYQITGNRKHGIHAFQICGGIMMFLVIFIFPLFLAITLPVYMGTKLYFKFRHKTVYPKIG
jgi:1,4-dihydroxy-2-naphthoate octaprenyltransferase